MVKTPAPQRKVEAEDPRTPGARLGELAADGNMHVRRAAAGNPRTPEDVIVLLRRGGSTADLSGFAKSDAKLSADEIERLVELGEWGRRLAARHPNTCPQVLRRLAAEEVQILRCDVARHENTPTDVLAKLCVDVSEDVRRAAFENPHAPPELIRQLQAIERGDDVDSAVLEQLVGHGIWARIIVARHPATPQHVLTKLAEDGHWEVRAAVAGNHSIGGELLMKLVDCDDPAVHLMLASHPGTPAEVLTRLAMDGRAEVREVVARHPALGGELVEMLRRAGSNRELTGFIEPDATLAPEVLVELARGGGWGRQLAARHANTPVATLVELAKGSDAMARMIVSRHPKLPRELRESLSLEWPRLGSRSNSGGVA